MEYWHTLAIPDIEKKLGSSARFGITREDASSRLKTHGQNKLTERRRDSIAIIFLRQFQSPLIYVLLAASVLVAAIGEITDSLIIFFVLCFNAIVGTIQEGKAQNTLAALKHFAQTPAVVIREGEESIIEDAEVVPGDLLMLQEGEKVPADARIVDAHDLRLDEAALTGESGPVHKLAGVLEKEQIPPAEQTNMVFKGTAVVGGNGRAIATGTGEHTFIGNISKSIALIDTEIPLKADIRMLSRLILFVVLVSALSLFSLGIYHERPLIETFLTVVSLSVSIIPEGLPIVITLVLANSVWRMAKRNALVKRLQAVEALGQAKIIAVDKTGTVTKNEMMVRELYVNGKTFTIEGNGYDPRGSILRGDAPVYSINHPELILAAKIAAFNSNAGILHITESDIWKIAGDPTEAALLVMAEKIGIKKQDLEKEMPFIDEKPFDYRTKLDISSHRIEGNLLHGGREEARQFVSIIGAPEKVLPLASSIYTVPEGFEGIRGTAEELTNAREQELENVFNQMLSDGMRVVAFGFKEAALDQNAVSENIRNITLAGLFGLSDSLRPEVSEAMRRAEEAGLKVVMITGDHKITAIAIAKQAAIYREGDGVITGDELAKMTDDELGAALEHTTVFARVTPEQKMKIIGGYRRRGEIIAMTGDGVNDAPSLVAADLGVAMGKIGTEVAKEAADIVLLDDNFGSIVSAIKEGRNIFSTIKKVLLYLFSTSLGELLTITGALAAGFPLPILPGQILWLNLITDGFLVVALAMEPEEKGLLEEKFKRPKRYLVDTLMVERIFIMGFVMTAGALLIFSRYFPTDLPKAWTITLTTLAIYQWFNAWNCRSTGKSFFLTNPFSNMFLVAATATIIALHVFAVYNPFMNGILKTVPLSGGEWAIAVVVASSILFIEEIRKFLYRRLVPGRI
ncbi:MAG: HAD-IC family P-type ATPase [Candidatus Liptonbacteria bacterium]|nr:HAD-IC family P-type ATPase [Candidatus Liptonbacteria bacterium]